METDHRLSSEVWLEPTPGHTPGHVSVVIESEGARVVISGDFLHYPCRIARPDWPSGSDIDADLAVATRRAALDRAADRPVLFSGTHFAGATEPCGWRCRGRRAFADDGYRRYGDGGFRPFSGIDASGVEGRLATKNTEFSKALQIERRR